MGLIEKITDAWSPVQRRSGGADTGGARRISSLLGGSRYDQLAQMGNVGTVFGIVDRVSSSFSQIEWCLYQRARSGKIEDRIEVTEHLALDLWRRPNDFHTGMMMREMGQQHYELTGETWLVIDREASYQRGTRLGDLPLGMWTVRPDRIEPVPGEKKFLVGYVYTSTDGEKIPLELDEVLHMKRPNPLDPYRGLGAIQSTMLEVQSARAVSEWNRNFFRNGAMPGGIIEVPNELDDRQWRTLMLRWRESHQGVGRAHRIGTLEHGAKFTPISYSIKDMMVTELRGMNRDAIMEAFGFSKFMLGIIDDVNRASAYASEYMYGKYVDRPRAIRWREMLNAFYLPLFGDARPLEFDFKNPVPEDEEVENASRESKARAASFWIDAGFEPDDVLTTVGAPPMRHTGSVPSRKVETA